MEKEFSMWTKKGNDFHELSRRVIELVAGDDCMVCARSSQQTVDQVATILREYGIDPKDVEAEMLTITERFAFANGWKKPHSGLGCYVLRRDFLTVCYKLLK